MSPTRVPYTVPSRIYVFNSLSRKPRFSWTKAQTNTSIPNHDSSMFVVVSGRHGTLPFHSIGPEVGFQQVIYKLAPTSRNCRRWRPVPDRWLPLFIISPLTALMLIGTAYPGLTSIVFCHSNVGVLQPLVLCDRLGYFRANTSTMG